MMMMMRRFALLVAVVLTAATLIATIGVSAQKAAAGNTSAAVADVPDFGAEADARGIITFVSLLLTACAGPTLLLETQMALAGFQFARCSNQSRETALRHLETPLPFPENLLPFVTIGDPQNGYFRGTLLSNVVIVPLIVFCCTVAAGFVLLNKKAAADRAAAAERRKRQKKAAKELHKEADKAEDEEASGTHRRSLAQSISFADPAAENNNGKNGDGGGDPLHEAAALTRQAREEEERRAAERAAKRAEASKLQQDAGSSDDDDNNNNSAGDGAKNDDKHKKSDGDDKQTPLLAAAGSGGASNSGATLKNKLSSAQLRGKMKAAAMAASGVNDGGTGARSAAPPLPLKAGALSASPSSNPDSFKAAFLDWMYHGATGTLLVILFALGSEGAMSAMGGIAGSPLESTDFGGDGTLIILFFVVWGLVNLPTAKFIVGKTPEKFVSEECTVMRIPAMGKPLCSASDTLLEQLNGDHMRALCMGTHVWRPTALKMTRQLTTVPLLFKFFHGPRSEDRRVQLANLMGIDLKQLQAEMAKKAAASAAAAGGSTASANESKKKDEDGAVAASPAPAPAAAADADAKHSESGSSPVPAVVVPGDGDAGEKNDGDVDAAAAAPASGDSAEKHDEGNDNTNNEDNDMLDAAASAMMSKNNNKSKNSPKKAKDDDDDGGDDGDGDDKKKKKKQKKDKDKKPAAGDLGSSMLQVRYRSWIWAGWFFWHLIFVNAIGYLRGNARVASTPGACQGLAGAAAGIEVVFAILIMVVRPFVIKSRNVTGCIVACFSALTSIIAAAGGAGTSVEGMTVFTTVLPLLFFIVTSLPRCALQHMWLVAPMPNNMVATLAKLNERQRKLQDLNEPPPPPPPKPVEEEAPQQHEEEEEQQQPAEEAAQNEAETAAAAPDEGATGTNNTGNNDGSGGGIGSDPKDGGETAQRDATAPSAGTAGDGSAEKKVPIVLTDSDDDNVPPPSAPPQHPSSSTRGVDRLVAAVDDDQYVETMLAMAIAPPTPQEEYLELGKQYDEERQRRKAAAGASASASIDAKEGDRVLQIVQQNGGNAVTVVDPKQQQLHQQQQNAADSDLDSDLDGEILSAEEQMQLMGMPSDRDAAAAAGATGAAGSPRSAMRQQQNESGWGPAGDGDFGSRHRPRRVSFSDAQRGRGGRADSDLDDPMMNDGAEYLNAEEMRRMVGGGGAADKFSPYQQQGPQWIRPAASAAGAGAAPPQQQRYRTFDSLDGLTPAARLAVEQFNQRQQKKSQIVLSSSEDDEDQNGSGNQYFYDPTVQRARPSYSSASVGGNGDAARQQRAEGPAERLARQRELEQRQREANALLDDIINESIATPRTRAVARNTILMPGPKPNKAFAKNQGRDDRPAPLDYNPGLSSSSPLAPKRIGGPPPMAAAAASPRSGGGAANINAQHGITHRQQPKRYAMDPSVAPLYHASSVFESDDIDPADVDEMERMMRDALL